jgi:exopolysaccharide production protein ExoZ
LRQPQPALNLTSIQALRGLAALAVAIAHLRSVELKFDPAPILGIWTAIGFGGVDLFFVISGFVMVWVTRRYQGNPKALPRFWLARFFRIYPLWWLVLSAIVAVWLIRPEWVYSSDTSTPDLLRSYLLLPATTLPLHLVGWTLIHEVWFYLIFGLLLLLPKRSLPVGLVIWAGIVAVWALAQPATADPVLKLIRNPLTLEFIAGAGVGLLATKGPLPFARPMMWLGCLILLLAALSVRENAQSIFAQEWPRIWLFGLPCAMIVWGVVGLEQAGNAPAPRWLQGLGDWSYGLYLIHVPAFVFISRLAKPLSQNGIVDNIGFLCAALATAILSAFILHAVFERPLQQLSRRLLKRLKSG